MIGHNVNPAEPSARASASGHRTVRDRGGVSRPAAAARCGFLALIACAATPASRAVNVHAEASAAWAENISHASASSDWRDAMRYEGRASLSLLREWRAGFMTTGELNAGYERVPKFSRLDAFGGGAALQLRQKFGLGAFAPALVLDLGLRRRDAKLEGDESWISSAGLSIRKRLTPGWRVGAVGDWQQHSARSPVFDTRHHRLFATVTWDPTSRLQISHGNGRLWGDFTAHASGSVWSRALSGQLGENIGRYYPTVPWTTTDSFGPRWVTYRVSGRVSFWWLEIAPVLGRNTSLPLRYESIFSVNKVGVKYRQDVWSLQVLHRF